jgi:hypothetical protein
LWAGNLYKNRVGDASLNSILEGSSLGLVLVDIVAVVLVLSAAPLSASIVALVAGYANVSFLVFSALGSNPEKTDLYRCVCDSTMFLALTLLLVGGLL